MANTSLRSWLLPALVAGSAVLGGCAEVCVGGGCVDAGSHAGIPLLYADAGVRVERPSKGELPYHSGMALQTGDIIQTTGGFAVIDFDDDNFVALREDTRIQLGSIKLFLGEVFAHIGKILDRGGGQVTTDEVSASVRGTEYSVRRTPFPGREDLGNTAVIVRNGTVSCEDPDGRWPPVQVVQNRMLRVEGKQLPGPPQYVDAQAETAWADRVIQRLLVQRPSRIQPGIGIPFPAGPPPRRDRPRPPRPTRPPSRENPG
jgi:FecR-like protein